MMSDANLKQISIASDFSRAPAGRYREDGPYNATKFRDDMLVPEIRTAIREDRKVAVILDGVLGYSSSFLEEVFGGLARTTDFSDKVLTEDLLIIANSRAYETAKRTAEFNLRVAMNVRHKSR
jgi:STAS-like domain of unknown function (DUF4325)